jgi:aldehyde dehydrogenase family 7 protein A1
MLYTLVKKVVERLKKAYGSIMNRLGDPLDDGTLYGPMHSKAGIDGYLKTLAEVRQLGGKIEFGGNVIESEGNFVEPTIVTGLPHDAAGTYFRLALLPAA